MSPVAAPARDVDRDPRPVAHLDPPTSPSRLLCDPGGRLVAVAGLFIFLAAAAAIDGGGLLLHVDEPIGRFAVTHRTDTLDTFFRSVSFLGSTKVVLIGGAVLALLAWRKCRMVALLVVAATLSRPLVEHVIKITVQRGRPSIDRMVNGVGYSFPSGHVMAAATLWLMVPVVVSLYTRSRRVWMASAIASVTLVVLIAASRVYLGVHWPIDVLAGGLAAAMLLAGLDLGFRRLHQPWPCGDARQPGDDVRRPVDDTVEAEVPELVA